MSGTLRRARVLRDAIILSPSWYRAYNWLTVLLTNQDVYDAADAIIEAADYDGVTLKLYLDQMLDVYGDAHGTPYLD